MLPWPSTMTRVASVSAGLIALCLVAPAAETVRPWREYRTIMWVGDSAYKDPTKTALFFQRLREMGINTAMVHGDGPLDPLLENNFLTMSRTWSIAGFALNGIPTSPIGINS